jgi:hypothetical protein
MDMIARGEPGKQVRGVGVHTLESDRSDGVAMSPGMSPPESTPIRTEGSSLLSTALAANFEGFWKLPSGMPTSLRSTSLR